MGGGEDQERERRGKCGVLDEVRYRERVEGMQRERKCEREKGKKRPRSHDNF
jgi:hypothetical protein